MPPSVDEWLPERHLARFVVGVVERLDLRAMTGSYRGSSEASYYTQRLLGLTIYGAARGAAGRDRQGATIEARARERHAHEQAGHDAKMAARTVKTAATGKKPGGRPPAPPIEGPLATDQVNLRTRQCYNAQAVVAAGSLLVIAAAVVQAPNDKQQLEPMLDKIADLPEALGKVGELLADNGYFSQGNVNACAAAGIDLVIAMGREARHPTLDERCAHPPPSPEDPTPLEAMSHHLKTPEGQKRYALRKQIPEPVFGIIKSALGFRQFLLRGLDNVRGEWSLVTMA